MKKVCVIGHFGFGYEMLNGQTIKTKILTKALEDHFGTEEVLKIDSCGGIKTLFKAPFQVMKAMRQSENVVILPAHNGVRVYVPLISFFSRFFKTTKVHYSVIGGWLPQLVQAKPRLVNQLKKLAGIYVETSTMKRSLDKMGFTNVVLMLNFKELQILPPDQMKSMQEPYKLCTFSRVLREKGIEDAVNAVQVINKLYDRTVFSLDIYGPVDSSQKEWFSHLQTTFPEYIQYSGCVPFDRSVQVLKEYFALLFPTRYYTEGVPGTIIDAYAAGLPVICSKWESFTDVVDEGTTGFGYEFGNGEELCELLQLCASRPEMVERLRLNCLKKATEYTPEKALMSMLKRI